MKILRISLRNLASLPGTHTVDFTAEPLRSAGLFSISGPTGSGKSTLLDALCLALYARTPRLNAVGRETKIDDAGEKISQNDVSNLLRRGTGEGFAEVAFLGVDNLIYTARWQVRRARNHPEGALQNTEVALFLGNTSPGGEGQLVHGGKKTELHPLIQQKIGLSFDQFTRAVLLAQNDFATFLKAKDNERAEILQALTGTELFETISIAVHQRTFEEIQKLKDIELQLSGNIPLSTEARTGLEEALASATQSVNRIQAALKCRESHSAWFTEFHRLTQETERSESLLREKILAQKNAEPRRIELAENQQILREATPLRKADTSLALRVATERHEAEEAAAKHEAALTQFARKTQSLSSARDQSQTASDAVLQLTPHIQRARELDAQLVPLKNTQDQNQQRLRSAQSSLSTVQSAHSDCTRKCAELRLCLESTDRKQTLLQNFTPFTKDSSAWIDRITAAAKLARQLKETAKLLKQRKEEAASQSDAAKHEAKQADAFTHAEEQTQSALKTAETALARLRETPTPHGQHETAASLHSSQVLLNELQNLTILTQQFTDLSKETASLQTSLSEDGALGESLRTIQIPGAKLAADTARNILSRTEAALADSTLALREKLTPEEACPVCGSRDHPYKETAPSAESVALRILRKDLEEKEISLNQLQGKLSGLEQSLQKEHLRLIEKGRLLEDSRLRVESTEAKINAHPSANQLQGLTLCQKIERISSQIGAVKDTLLQLEAIERDHKNAETLYQTCFQAHQTALKARQASEKRCAERQHSLSLAAVTADAAEENHRLTQIQAAESRSVLAPLFESIPSAAADFERDPEAFGDQTKASFDTTLELETERASFASNLARHTAQIEPLQNALTQANTQIAEREAELLSATADYQLVHSERMKLLDGKDAQTLENEIKSAVQVATGRLETAQKEVEAARTDIATALEGLEIKRATFKNTQTSYAEAQTQLHQWLQQFRERTTRILETDSLDQILRLDPSWFADELEFLSTIDKSLHAAQGALQVHQHSESTHVAQRPTADDAATVNSDIALFQNQLLEAESALKPLQESIFNDNRCTAQSTELLAKRHALDAAATPWRNLNELIGSPRGDKFQHIAQRRTLDILLTYANAQLELFAGRYRLERLHESLNLIVLDRDMGDERRSVHSLSGGESFLVSLALALALASLTSNRLRIESLFIDEGFGSLDPETLNTAMGALMQLEAQGRKVGVISHVSEMADAIPVQIRVVTTRAGTSSLVVPGQQTREEEQEKHEPRGGHSAKNQADLQGLAASFLEILKRETHAGQNKVSTTALRKELGCSSAEFTAVRDLLAEKITAEGRSISFKS